MLVSLIAAIVAALLYGVASVMQAIAVRAASNKPAPPSSSQLSTGTLSQFAIGSSHWRQCDRGHTTDSPAGSRTMQTLRKLPSSKPNNPKKRQGSIGDDHSNSRGNPQAHRLHC